MIENQSLISISKIILLVSNGDEFLVSLDF